MAGCGQRSVAFVEIKKKILGKGVGLGGFRLNVNGVFVGEGGSKVWGRWVMWGMGM